MSDWLILEEKAGFKRLEWAQESSHLSKYITYQKYINGSSTVFILDYFECRGKMI